MNKSNIYLRKDGRYEGRVFLDTSKGNRRYHAFFGKSPEEVSAKMTEYRQNISVNTDIHKTFSAVYSEWFRSVSIRIKESTAANYTLKADKHILPAFGKRDICSISQELIYNFIKTKQNEKLSNRYITDILILMKSVFKYASKNYNIRNVMEDIVMPKNYRADVRILTEEEDRKLCEILSEKPSLTSMGISLARVTGLRIGELCALKWGDIDLDQRILNISKTLQRIQTKNSTSKTKLILAEPKSETSKRKIPIPECIFSLLKEHKENENHYILSGNEKPVEPRTIQYRFAKILKNGNLPSVHFHAIRHFFASNCIKLGFDVKALSEILGHSSVEITLNRYVHSSFEQKAEYMNRLK